MTKLYRAHIIRYPEMQEVYAERHLDHPEDGGDYFPRPVGWTPDANYVSRFRTERWIEPDTSKFFKSRSSAQARVDILREAGYDAIVQQSAPVQWPRDGQKRVEVSDWERIKRAVRELVDLGVIKSADEIL